MGKTSIPWTNETWNPVRGCTRVSEGCRNCYAERFAARFAAPGEPFHGLVTVRSKASGLRYRDPRAAGSWTEPRWTGEVHFAEDHFADPLRWRNQRLVFVNSVSDLFHPAIPFELIAAIVGIMAVASGNVFQVLTKRPERMAEFMAWVERQGRAHSFPGAFWYCLRQAQQRLDQIEPDRVIDVDRLTVAWPLPNVWWGVSIENQKAANERIPILLDVPAAVRWLSVEPLLEPIELPRHDQSMGPSYSPIDWVVVGGESGPGARPFDLSWARALRVQCGADRVPFFFKQAGANPMDWGKPLRLNSRKGEDLAELPEDLRVREWPGRLAA